MSRVDFLKRFFLGDGEDLFDDALGIGELMRFDILRVNRGGIDGADTFDGGIEVVEGMLLNQRGDLGGDAAERF